MVSSRIILQAREESAMRGFSSMRRDERLLRGTRRDETSATTATTSTMQEHLAAAGGKQMVMWQRGKAKVTSAPRVPLLCPLALSFSLERAHCVRISAPQIINIRGRGTGIFCGRRYDEALNHLARFVASRFELID